MEKGPGFSICDWLARFSGLAKEILEGRFGPKDTITVGSRNSGIVFLRLKLCGGVTQSAVGSLHSLIMGAKEEVAHLARPPNEEAQGVGLCPDSAF